MAEIPSGKWAIRLERERRKTVREERLAKILADPQLMGLLTMLGGLYVSQRIPWSEDPTRNDLLRALATTGVILAALSRAGIGGWQALVAAGAGGSAAGGAFDFLGSKDAAGFLLGEDKRLFGIPLPGLTPSSDSSSTSLAMTRM